MNYNKTGAQQNTTSFGSNSSWETFNSRTDWQPSYKNNAKPNLNDQTNFSDSRNSLYQFNSGISNNLKSSGFQESNQQYANTNVIGYSLGYQSTNINDRFQKSSNAKDPDLDTKQQYSNAKGIGYSSGSYGNQNTNNCDSFQKGNSNVNASNSNTKSFGSSCGPYNNQNANNNDGCYDTQQQYSNDNSLGYYSGTYGNQATNNSSWPQKSSSVNDSNLSGSSDTRQQYSNAKSFSYSSTPFNNQNTDNSNRFQRSSNINAPNPGESYNTHQQYSNAKSFENSSDFYGNQSNNNSDRSFGTKQQYSNPKGFGYLSGNQDGNYSDRYQKNSYRSQQTSLNFNNLSSQQNKTTSLQYQSNSKNTGGTWMSGSGSSFLANANKVNFPNSNESNQTINIGNGYGNTNSNYVPFKKFKQHYTNRQNKTSTNDKEPSAVSLFMGKNESYPKELNNLMNPFFCGLCNSRLNSIKSANIHYESKAHDKQISNWMKKTFTDKGLNPPEVKRFVNTDAAGPYRCKVCTLDLTSPQHALQHYNGKRHRQLATKITPPTGIGYYNVNGDWVETGKVFDKVTGKETSYILISTPSGFEPVVLHVASKVTTTSNNKRPAGVEENFSEESPTKKPHLEETNNSEKEKKEEELRAMVTNYEIKKQREKDTSASAGDQSKIVPANATESSNTSQTPQEALKSQQCLICGISTTSYDQMLLHLKGIRHTKKLRALGEPPITDFFQKSNTILESLTTNNSSSDISMYRTPTGSYYCKTCNASLEDVARIKQHIASKAHLAVAKKIKKETI